jgi:curved DNA-binding protein CbpA
MAAPSPDPYQILGVSPGATDDELHTAYRRLVQIHHPDHNRGSAESTRRFEEIQRAYSQIREQRERAPGADDAPPRVTVDPDVDARLADLERDDSLAKILADARAEMSDRLGQAREHPVGKRVAELIDQLAAKLTGGSPPDSRG